jgi:hypothetical protein
MTKSIYLSSRIITFIVIASPPLFVILSLSLFIILREPVAILLEMAGR